MAESPLATISAVDRVIAENPVVFIHFGGDGYKRSVELRKVLAADASRYPEIVIHYVDAESSDPLLERWKIDSIPSCFTFCMQKHMRQYDVTSGDYGEIQRVLRDIVVVARKHAHDTKTQLPYVAPPEYDDVPPNHMDEDVAASTATLAELKRDMEASKQQQASGSK